MGTGDPLSGPTRHSGADPGGTEHGVRFSPLHILGLGELGCSLRGSVTIEGFQVAFSFLSPLTPVLRLLESP